MFNFEPTMKRIQLN